ncbi:glycosyltransferase family 9 protein [Pararhodospirillum oryzae]|uniref:Glycosyl transferase n=1 Tax=Pararhodospirillum oryzae TaxID=478448 RepID=A0A512H475_9PROT|nr:glycosyltransferase family 9 protein [Pararhodospirillum oryzae]GEO80274.1 glycosyl transferase [Pararhodospirillum oryzae]
MTLLFITATRIGDAVLSTGLLDHWLGTHPGCSVTIACGPLAADLFEAVPGRERTVVLTKGPYARHWRGLWRTCVGRRWDAIIDLRASAVTWLMRARERHWLGPDATGAHQVVRLGRLLGLDPPPAPRLWLGPAHREAGLRLVPPGPPVLAVAPIANWHAKTWPAERFAAVVRHLTGPTGPLPGGRVAVLGAGSEREAAAPVLNALPASRCLDLMGQGRLPEIQAALERCAFFVGNDSGLMHMAAAAGLPTLGLFGPTPETVYGPWGPKAAVVRTPEPAHVLFPPGTDAARIPAAMNTLDVGSVITAAEALWERLAP